MKHIALYESIKPGFPRSYFFRHETRKGGIKAGRRYGEKYFYKWWKKAFEKLSIEEIDLYGGTRHSSVIALQKHFSPEQIKQGTMHQTNKAFERYFKVGADDIRTIYGESAGKKVGKKMTDIKEKQNI